MWNFDLFMLEYGSLSPRNRQIIEGGIQQLAHGLLEFTDRPALHTTSEYNLYCHYYGGSVSITLARLFASSGVESPCLGNEEHLNNSLGLLVIKARTVTSILEQVQEGRVRWPREIWELYCGDGDFENWLVSKNKSALIFCLNHMVLDAMRHVFDTYKFLSHLEDRSIFRLYAIEQMASIMILSKAYGMDPARPVELSKAELATLHRELHGLSDFQSLLVSQLNRIREKVVNGDPTSGQMMVLLAQLDMLSSRTRNRSLILLPWRLTTGGLVELLFFAIISGYLFHVMLLM